MTTSPPNGSIGNDGENLADPSMDSGAVEDLLRKLKMLEKQLQKAGIQVFVLPYTLRCLK
jgi:hypothetical protein